MRAIYRRWARGLLERGLGSPDARSDRILSILEMHAPTVAARLDQDPDFRRRFHDEIAPLAESIFLKERGDSEEWGFRAGTPAIWEFLQAYGTRGRDWCEAVGVVAIDLLTTAEYRGVRDKIAEAVRLGDQRTLEALFNDNLRERPLFIELLERDLPAGTLATALASLQAEPRAVPNLLSYYAGLSDADLIKELGPPPSGPITWLPGYAIYEVADKIRAGRDVGKLDMAFAAIEAFEAVTVAKGAKYALKTVQSAVKNSLERQGARAAAETAARATSRQLLPWTLSHASAAAREALGRAASMGNVEVTTVVRIAFQKSGVGRETFRNLTRLEARVFMRGDRRVFIDLGSALAKDHALRRYLNATAVNALADSGFKAAVATEAGGRVVGVTLDQLEAWKKHVSVWWLANARRSLDRLGPPSGAVAAP